MAQIDGAGQQDTDNQNAEALQAALAQRQVTLQGQPQGGSDVPIHQNSDPVSDESEILRSCQPLTGKRRVPCLAREGAAQALVLPCRANLPISPDMKRFYILAITSLTLFGRGSHEEKPLPLAEKSKKFYVGSIHHSPVTI